MTAKTEYRRVSKRARLLLSYEEGYDVEFKLSLGQLDTQDMVAFTNSATGGAILIGIEEVKISSGRQKGVIRGCPVGDREKQSIISRAESCVPPVEIEVFVENSSRTPFYRAEIPSGSQKPYCTAGGIYKIRGDGRTKPLLPSRLLYLFIESEGSEFVERFRDATTELEAGLLDTRDRVVQEMKSLLGNVERMEQRIEGSLERVFASAENAGALSDDAMSFSEETVGGINQILVKLEELESYPLYGIQEKMEALLKHFDIEDPRIRAARIWVEEQTEILHGKGAKEKEILEKLTRQWEAGGIPAAWSEIWKWSTKKLSELEEQERG